MITKNTKKNSSQNAPGRPPGVPWRRPDGPKRRLKSAKKKLKSVQEGAKTRQDAKFGGPKRAPRRAKMDPRGKCKYFFTGGLKKYWVPFLDYFWPLPRAYFFTFLHQNSSFYQHKTRFFAFICMNFHVFGAIFGASWASWRPLERSWTH